MLHSHMIVAILPRVIAKEHKGQVLSYKNIHPHSLLVLVEACAITLYDIYLRRDVGWFIVMLELDSNLVN